MGGQKTTREQVKGDLERQLIAAAKQLEQDTFGTQSSTNDFEPLLHDIASRQFQRKYGFAYNDDGNQVHPIATNGDNPNTVVTTSKLCSIDRSIDVDIPVYIDDGILRGLNLPTWMKENVKGDLGTTAKHLLAINTDGKWQWSEYFQTYDGANGDGDQSSYQVKSVLVYVNGTLTEDGVSVNMCILYYMAAFYKVVSQTQQARQALENEAYKKVPGGGANDLLSLSRALQTYATSKYQTQFGYGYAGTPTDLVKTTQPYCKFNEHLFYTPDLASVEDGRLQEMIENQLFRGLNLTIKDVYTSVLADIMKEFKDMQATHSADSWLDRKFEQTYQPTSTGLNRIRTNVTIVSFYNEHTIDQGKTIKVLYIYCMAGFYEVLDPKVIVSRDVLKKLVENLHPPKDVTSDPTTLSNLLDEYARTQFKQKFSFDYEKSDSKPADEAKFIQRYSTLYALADYSADTIKKYTNQELFEPDVTGPFPPDVATKIFEKINTRVGSYAADEQNPDNQWIVNPNHYEYHRKDATKKPVKEYSVFVHALGQGANDADGGAIIKRAYVYYLSYFCFIKPSSEDDTTKD